MEVHTMKNIVKSIKLNQTTVEKWMPYQSIKELLHVYFIISKGMVPKLMPK